jgi:DNA-binding transcriptional regulator GbsR (MarR family)
MFTVFDEYITQLRLFFQEVADLNTRKPKLHEILILLQCKPGLTQNDLMNITNYSRGAISGYLFELQKIGIIKISKDPHSRKKKYFPYSQQVVLDYRTYFSTADNVKEINDFMEIYLKKMENVLKRKEVTEKAPQIYLRLKEFHDHFLVVKKNQDPTYPHSIHWMELVEDIKNLITTTSNTLPIYEPEIPNLLLPLEQEFHHFLVNSKQFSELDPRETQVYGFLITRGRLSLTTLAALTGISTGKMSKILRKFCRKQVCHYLGKYEGYGMVSFITHWMSYTFNYYKELIRWEEKFRQPFQNLSNFPKKFINHSDFPRIYTIFAQILFALQQSIQTYQKWEEVEIIVQDIFQRVYY